MRDPIDTHDVSVAPDASVKAESNVWPLFGKRDRAGRRQPLDTDWENTHLDSTDFVRHDRSPPAAAGPKRAIPTRRHNMPRLARQALDQDGMSTRPDEGEAWKPPQADTPDWNHAPNDRMGADDRHNRLARTLELDIIPRLVSVHRALPAALDASTAFDAPPTTQDVENFVQLVLAREHVPAQAFIDVLAQHGMTVETIYLDLLAPAAQHLNYLWSQDLCDFTQVTLGLARLQRLMHELSPAMQGERHARSNARRVLLIPVRGEQQTFGLSMVGEFFHHAGWEVDCGGVSLHTDAVDLMQAEWFDLVGLLAGSETRLDNLRACIRDLRASSRNRNVDVMVGGPIFAGHAERVRFVGADASGLDGKQAPVVAGKLKAPRSPSQ